MSAAVQSLGFVVLLSLAVILAARLHWLTR